MIISHTYRYLFVELPRTGSTAISRELRAHYDGKPILSKHATYCDFLKSASAEEKKYLVFAGIRNPLDDAVSHYFKYKTDHRQQFTDPRKVGKKRMSIYYFDKLAFHFVRQRSADFPTFFKTFYKIPYNNWSQLSHKQFDFILRFESIQDDFASALELIGIQPIRPLPIVNRTSGKAGDFWSYYTPEIIPRARRIFGPFMKQWGYQFPPEWGPTEVPWWNQLEFDVFNVFRSIYWKHLKAYL
ncbi:MAG TPA: sulfotransferase family 2 domain-containing protein [Herpetosiphonaceae bacterium]